MKTLVLFVLVLGIAGCVPQNMIAPKGMLPEVCQNFKAEDPDALSDTYAANRAFWQSFNNYYEANKDKGPKKLVVFMDGTGNDKSKRTNVRKMYRLAVEQACHGVPVVPYYDKGVGAKWFDRVRGGLAGRGTSLNIRQAYRFLVESYNTNDEIYLIGFSRGAFTARSLNGFIELAGLLDRATVEHKWYEILPLPGFTNMHFTVSDLYDTYQQNFSGKIGFESRLQQDLKDIMDSRGVKAYSHNVEVAAIGVFDTVPALGLFRDDEPDDHRLGLYAKKGFHALSLDEQRDDFRLLRFDPFKAKQGSELREVWFAGVHSDIGGSYSYSFNCQEVRHDTRKPYRPGLGTATLNWMLRNFEGTGIFASRDPYGECPNGSLHDEFFGSWPILYKWLTLGTFPRAPRPGDWIHGTVVQRLAISSLPDAHEEREVHPESKKKQYSFLGMQGEAALDRYFPRDSITGGYSEDMFFICDSVRPNPALNHVTTHPVSATLDSHDTKCSFNRVPK